LPELVAAKGEESVLDATGPFLLTRAQKNWDENTILAPALIYPPITSKRERSRPRTSTELAKPTPFTTGQAAGCVNARRT
jgi:hypothetical protein